MPIPDYQTAMLPILKIMADGQERTRPQVSSLVADVFELNEKEREQLLPGGTALVIRSRTGWAMSYLTQALLLERPRRAVYRISARGLKVLAENPARVDVDYLDRFPEFVAFRRLRHDSVAESPVSETESALDQQTPEEALQNAYQRLRRELESEVMSQLKSLDPSFFERLVVKVLVGMGYGGTLVDAGRAVGQSGDGGIDGIIKEDKLGLDQIYVQAKRWEQTVGRPDIQKFAGALQGHRARKGVFITTSQFSRDAYEYAERIDSRIILIDGATLASLMIDHNVGVTTTDVYEIKQMDRDFFSED